MAKDLYPVALVGTSFYQEQIDWCAEGERVWVCYEPDNPHDHLALRVETGGGRTIGYISRGSWVRRAVYEQGRGITATIEAIRTSNGGPMGVVINVALTDDDLPVRSYFPGTAPIEPPPGGFRAWVSPPATGSSVGGHIEGAQRRSA